MTDETNPQPAPRRLSALGLRNRTPREGASPPAGNADAGAVLRRSPPPGATPGRPVPGPVRPVRPLSSIVDTTDRTAPRRLGHVAHPTIVDTTDQEAAAEPEFGLPPVPRATDVGPPRPRHPASRQPTHTGPDPDRVRQSRDARKRKLAERARARGVDPGAGSVLTESGHTRSKETENQYRDRGQTLMKRYLRERNLPNSVDNIDPIEFVNWFLSLKPGLKASTWRPYRQSAKAFLMNMPNGDVESAMAMIDVDIAQPTQTEDDDTETSKAPKSRNEGLPRRTSNLKEKRFPKADFDRTIAFLRHFSRSNLRETLIDWLIAGVTTGLRPIEWQATELEVIENPSVPNGRTVWLYVINAKATNGRSNGLVRTIDVSHFSDSALGSIRRMSEQGNGWMMAGKYDSMQSQCAQLLYSVCERLFAGRNKIYSLYSLRHQFIANAKTYLKPEAVSALAGHVITDTVHENYAKRNSAWGPEEIADCADPVPEEVSTVKQRLRFFEDRERMKAEAGLNR